MEKNKGGKRVLIVLHLFGAGGSERQAFLLARGLRDRGHQVFVRGFGTGGGTAMDWFRSEGFDCEPFGFREKVLLGTGTVTSYLRKW